MVIGEPASPPEYPPLPGAYKEARAVFECLSAAGKDVVGTVTKVMAELEHESCPPQALWAHDGGQNV